jgi:serine/threonine protein kinase
MAAESVEGVCNLLARSGLLTAGQVRSLLPRWRAEAGGSGDAAALCAWLVSAGYVTDYQAGLVLRGKVDHFFFGPYKILERVGKGRMAGVYKAVHSLGQLVAIKVLPPSKAKEPLLLARFQREARLAMRLTHPNVVRTFQAGKFDDLHYIVMEYLDGETLEDVIRRRGRLAPPEAVRLIHQALLGLQHVHELGMIHRDVKPGNLMLVGGTPESTRKAAVKLMDIGLGKALFDEGSEGEGSLALTNEGSLLGTPDYMAPEQARDVQAADIRADVYAAGCTLYHALAGQVPFAESNLVKLLMRHATEAPRPLAQLNPAVPDGLRQIVEWMMAKDPAKRYPTPGRAAQALQVYLAAGEEQPARADPKMVAYLEWLDSQSGESGGAAAVADVELVPVASPVEPVAAAQAPPLPAGVATPDRAGRKSGARERPPEPRPARKGRPKAGRRREEDDEDEAPGLLQRRDFLMLALGGIALGVAVLLVVGFVYAVTHLLQPKPAPPPPDPGEPAP